MRDIRESFYTCSFDSPTRRRVAHVRAWDAREAIDLFVVELRDDGIEEPGEVAAVPLGGGRGAKARFRARRAH